MLTKGSSMLPMGICSFTFSCRAFTPFYDVVVRMIVERTLSSEWVQFPPSVFMINETYAKVKQNLENRIAKGENTQQLANMWVLLCESVYGENCDRDFVLECCKGAKEYLEQYNIATSGKTLWEAEKIVFGKAEYEPLDLYYRVLLIEARLRVFDSYMIYLERKREIKDRFYMPRRKQLVKFGLIDGLQGLIEDKYDILCISLPPGTGKTTLEKFFNSAVIGWYPKDYNLFYSHSSDITRMYYDGTYDIVSNSDEYCWNEIFPDLKVTSTNAKMEQFNIGKYKPFPSLQCTSIGSSNAGKVRCSKFLFVDDMIASLEQSLNKSILEKLFNAYAVDARQRKTIDSDGKPCKEIHIATRWSVADVIGRVMQMYEGNRRVLAIAVPDIDPVSGESNFDYEVGGLTKAFFNDQALLMDDISYRCLYKQQPIEREGLLYHEDELRRYFTLPNEEPDAIISICDVKNRGTDFMFLPVAYRYGDDYYIEDCVCDDNADFGKQEQKCSDILLAHNVQQCQFESNNGGDRFATNVSELVKEKGGRCNITTKPTETNKETKIIVNADWVKKHCLFRAKETYQPKSDYGLMMSFLVSYSIAGKNIHDDIPDGMAMFALFVTGRDRVRETRIIRCPF